jgi:magnesium-transporting ATPase (P-type)
VLLGLGDKIPADLRLLQVSNLSAEEAALTGESVPIDKFVDVIAAPEGMDSSQVAIGDRKNMCFSATLVAQGSATGVVIATGDETQIGTINKMVNMTEKKKTAVLEQIDKVSIILAVLIGMATLATFLVARFSANQEWFEAISTALVCCVAMVPEGLEAIVTLTYAWAVKNMAEKNAIIRALPAVETLGSVTVICSDKTGTLTQNIMSLTAFVTSNARYKFDVDSTDRVPGNFVRDNSYLKERAVLDLSKKKKRTASFKETAAETPVKVSEVAVAEDESDPFPFANGQSPDVAFVQKSLACGVLCSKCKLGVNGGREGALGNPTELSILRAAYFSGVDIENQKKTAPLVAEVPFSSEYKFMATVHDIGLPNDELLVYAKGAPDRMVELCKNQARGGVVGEDEPINKDYWLEQIAILSSHGLRVLALCQAHVKKSEVSTDGDLGPEFVNGRAEKQWLTLVGLCAIMDPPRPECVEAIREAHSAGVRVAMITGDHKDTATAIGHMLGIVDEKYPSAITGPEMDKMNEEQLKEAVLKYNVFARASPANKIQIVTALQAQKQICSMTGDGVNDAPALKAADMGVAMGKEGTDVAREASEMILADDNFATIVVAVREGRVVWDNLRKVLLVNTPINNAQGMSVLFGLAFGLELSPLSPIQVLYSNLICAITLGFVTAIEPAEKGIMSLPPRRIGKRLIGRYLLLRILLGTFTLTFLVVGSCFWILSYNPKDTFDYVFANLGGNCEAGCVFSNDGNVTGACKGGPFPAGVIGQKMEYCLPDVRALAFNVLDFGAISVTLSARFAYNSSISPRIFRGNKYCWYSVFIVAVLQVFITYCPGINDTIFLMEGMDGVQWGITFLFMAIVFLVMEAEKALRRALKNSGSDTDDREFDEAFDEEDTGPRKKFNMPASFKLFKKTSSKKNN